MTRAVIQRRPTWRRSVPDVRQAETAECGLACLAMVAAYHGQRSDLATLRRQHQVSLKGTTLAGLMDTAERMGLAGRPLRLEPASLARLAKFPNLTSLNLWNAKVTDAGLAEIAKLPLRELVLTETPITDAALVHIGQMTKLQRLVLTETPITNAGLAYLHSLKSLRFLGLRGTGVTAEGLNRLRATLPQCKILESSADPDTGESSDTDSAKA